MSKEFSIPKISDEELRSRAARIKALVRKGGKLYTIEQPKNLRQTAFLWDPVFEERSGVVMEIGRVKTLHSYGAPSLFKPSIAEVLAQIPPELAAKVKAFEVLGPGTANDLNDHWDELNAGFHVAETILYQ